MDKFYLLYDNKKQDKLLSMAANEEKLKNETEYYNTGVWFSYDQKENSNILDNEKLMKNIEFPAQAKLRESYLEIKNKKIEFKWLS